MKNMQQQLSEIVWSCL